MTVPATVPTAGPQASPAAEPTASPTAVPSAASTAAPMAAPTTPTQKVRSAVKPSAIGGRTVVQPNWAQDADDEWDVGLDDADWDTLEGEGAASRSRLVARRRRPRPGIRRFPEPIGTFAQHGHPWQAAFVVSEVLGPPRACRRTGCILGDSGEVNSAQPAVLNRLHRRIRCSGRGQRWHAQL